jgi:Flp pilus assembly pilin Flp
VSKIRSSINRLRRRGDRGASGVEYALVVSLVLTGSTATFEMMDDRVSEHYTETADDIGESDLAAFHVTTTTCDGCDATSTTTSTTIVATSIPTTTTNAPVTTTSVVLETTTTSTTTTTTTAPPTTTSTTTTAPPTTLPPTTTAAPGNPESSASFTNQSYEAWNGWKAKTRIELRDDDGKKLKYAEFEVTWVTANGETRTRTYETNRNGRKTPTWGKLHRSDFPVVMTINWIEDGDEQYTPVPATYVITRN